MSAIKDMLIKHESLRLYPYKDTTGHLTIGVGRNLTEKGITEDEAMFLLDNDIAEVTQELNSWIPWFKDQPEMVQVVMMDLAFNLGIQGLLGFHNTLEHIRKGEYKQASVEILLSLWAKQTGERAIELSNILKTINA